MFKINIKQLFLSIMVGILITACDDNDNFVAPIIHNEVDGLELFIENTLVYKEFQQAYYDANGNVVISSSDNPITLNTDEEYEVTVHFLNDVGEELEEIEEEEHNDELAFEIIGNQIIEFHTDHHGTCVCADDTDTSLVENETECESVCTDGISGLWEEESHQLEFEIETSDMTGTTTFKISLMHLIDGIPHPDFTSKLITVNVE